MTISPAENPNIIPLGPSPWETAAQRADQGEIAHLADEAGHRYVVMTEEQYLAWDEALENAEYEAWAERNRARIGAMRAQYMAGRRGISLEQIKAELNSADAQ